MTETLTVTTWNINSVRLRIGLVERFLAEVAPDILCLQEIKCQTDSFPSKAFRAAGYEHLAVNGQKGYHGVAIASRLPLANHDSRTFCEIDEARHQSVEVDFAGAPLVLHNFYVPAGGDDPDPKTNPKFAHKLAFVDEMTDWLSGKETDRPAILVGDLNIAPLETDVWSHKQLLKVVSHTPVETEALDAALAAGPWIDAMRETVPPQERLYTWWSYRSKDWSAADKGRRLDHVWITPPLGPRLDRVDVLRDARGWERPSDHAPVVARFTA